MTKPRESDSKDYADCIDLLEQRINECMDTYSDDATTEHFAYDFVVAELFETTEEGSGFAFTDGKGDKGIDFYVKRDQDYVAYQCKMPTLETLKTARAPVAFDAPVVADLNEAINHLAGEGNGGARANPRVARLKSMFLQDFHLDKEKVSFKLILAVCGVLNPDADAAFKSLQKRTQEATPWLTLRCLHWRDLRRELCAPTPSRAVPKEMTLRYREGELLSHRDWAYMLTPASDLLSAFNEYGFSLFELNVRQELRSSPVNKKIIESLKRATTQRKFHHLNNGITIACSSFRRSTTSQKGQVVTVSDPQIINGCQTVVSIYRAWDEMASNLQESFKNDCYVQVRVIRTSAPEFIGELVISTNRQNPMNPRNLKANDTIQQLLKAQFKALPHSWFYERKDGESESFWFMPPPGFKKRDYQDATGGRKRVADNEAVARAWYSFAGYASLASERAKLFEDAEPHYDRIFKRIPRPETWSKIAGHDRVFTYADEDYETGTPSACQLMLAFLTAEFVRRYTVSNKANRNDARQRLGLDKEVEGKHLKTEEIEGRLMEDPDYAVNQMLANMKEVVVELYATVFKWRYGPLDAGCCERLLRLPCYARLLEAPDFGSFAKELWDGQGTNPENVLYSIYEFIKQGVVNFWGKYQDAYNAAERKRRFLHREESILNMKRVLHQLNYQSKKLVYDWKKPDTMFVESLPPLP